MKEDKRGALTRAPLTASLRGLCLRRVSGANTIFCHLLLSVAFLPLPTQARRRRRPQLPPAHTRQRAGSGTMGHLHCVSVGLAAHPGKSGIGILPMGLGLPQVKDAYGRGKGPGASRIRTRRTGCRALPWGKGKLQLPRKNSRVAEIDHGQACLSPWNRERKKLLPHGTDFAFS